MRDSKTVSMPEMNMETDTDATLTSVCETLICDAVIEHCEQIHDDNRAEALGTSVKYKERMQQLRVCATVEEERMREEILRRRKTQRHQSVMRGVRIAAMSMAAMLVLMVAVPAVQTYAKKLFSERMVIENYSDHIIVSFKPYRDWIINNAIEDVVWKPQYTPQGFELKNEIIHQWSGYYQYRSTEKNSPVFVVSYEALNQQTSTYFLDNEYTNVRTEEIDSIKVLIGESLRPEFWSYWIWEQNGYCFRMIGWESMEEFEKVFKSICVVE